MIGQPRPPLRLGVLVGVVLADDVRMIGQPRPPLRLGVLVGVVLADDVREFMQGACFFFCEFFSCPFDGIG